jgi:hypothetical protein
LPDARGTEWAALGILVFVIVLFGVMPSLAITPVKTATGPLLQRLHLPHNALNHGGNALTENTERSDDLRDLRVETSVVKPSRPAESSR